MFPEQESVCILYSVPALLCSADAEQMEAQLKAGQNTGIAVELMSLRTQTSPALNCFRACSTFGGWRSLRALPTKLNDLGITLVM